MHGTETWAEALATLTSPGAVLVACGFAALLLLTAISQGRGPFSQRLRSFDLFSLLPRWTFFAPNPGVVDYHLLLRDRLHDGSLATPRQVPLRPPRRLHHLLWNPQKRLHKVLTDAVQSLPHLSESMQARRLRTSLPYLMILNHVAALERSPLVASRQFVIVATGGEVPIRQPGILFESQFHRFETAGEQRSEASRPTPSPLDPRTAPGGAR
ncbi:MAG: hypothetical protein DWQ36_14415 [Acidobacteria bacterium]|mgnify:CR=1 FL=1|nr:MAG: hypothetical protein DWQ30_23180 [Acidobacteriota bacterium]REK06086.1 MAG: hypothetical protein DWQ36_14415 [Acidobacteriota bacterium]